MKKIYYCFLGVLLLVGCGSTSTEKTDKNKSQIQNETNRNSVVNQVDSNKKVDYDQLRKKANVAETASMLGYDGKAIKKDLNKIIDEREKMDKQLKDLDL